MSPVFSNTLKIAMLTGIGFLSGFIVGFIKATRIETEEYNKMTRVFNKTIKSRDETINKLKVALY